MKKKFSVLDSFEIAAVEKGLMPDAKLLNSVGKLKKSASVSGNLLSDIPTLASELRKRAMFKEAEELENAFVNFTRTKTAFDASLNGFFSEMLDFAHPDGDVKVHESEYGVFHTLRGTQEHMLANLNKKASNSDIKRNMVKSAAFALGFLKKSQELAPLENQELLQYSAEDIKKIREIDSGIVASNDSVKKIVDGIIGSMQVLSVQFKNISALNNPDLFNFYCKANGLDPISYMTFERYLLTYCGVKDLTAENLENAKQTLTNFMNNLDYNGGLIFGKAIPGMSKFFNGVVSTVGDKTNKLQQNSNSIWTLIEIKSTSIDDKALLESAALALSGNPYAGYVPAAQSLIGNTDVSMTRVPENTNAAIETAFNYFTSVYNKYHSIEGLTTAQASLDSIGAMLLEPLKSIKTSINLLSTTKSMEILKTEVDAVTKSFEPALETWSGSTGDAIQSVLSKWLTSNYTKLKVASEIFPKAYETWAKSAPSMIVDDAISYETLLQIQSRLFWAGSSWKNFYQNDKSLPEKTKSSIGQAYNQIAAVMSAMSAAPTKDNKIPFFKVKEALAKQNISSWKELQNFAASAYQIASENIPEQYKGKRDQKSQDAWDINDPENPMFEKKNSLNIELKKQAQAINPFGGSKPVASGGAKSAPASQGNAAVKTMQFALQQFAAKVLGSDAEKFQAAQADIPTILSVGPSNATALQMDGKWGPNTVNAIKAANKSLTSKLFDGAPSMMSKSEEEITKAANANVNQLAQVLRAFNVQVEGVSAGPVANALDKISVDESLNVLDGQISISRADLATVQSFYNFLIKNKLVEATVEGDDKGFPTSTWEALFDSFLARAEEKLDNFGVVGVKSKKNALDYKTALESLRNNYYAFISSIRSQFDLVGDFLVDESFLTQAKSKPSVKNVKEYSTEDRASAWNENGRKRTNLDGTEISTDEENNESPPINDTLNFSSSYWRGTNVDEFLNSGILSLQQFRSAGATTMAKSLFANQKPQSEFKKQVEFAKQYFSVSNIGQNTAGTAVFVNNNGNWVPVTSFPQYAKSKSYEDLAEGTLGTYRKFLQALEAGLAQANDAWVRTTQPPEQLQVAINRKHQLWLTAIADQMRQIERTVK